MSIGPATGNAAIGHQPYEADMIQPLELHYV